MPKTFSAFMVQFIAYACFFGVIFVLSTSPAYEYLKPGQAEVKLAFKHTSQREEPCQEITPEELQKLPPNMRKPKNCPRKRAPIYIELLLDDNFLATRTFIPPGVSQDMSTFVYAKFSLPAGEHKLTVRMRDSARTDNGFDFIEETRRDWRPGQGIRIEFDESVDRFVIN
ncbi:hypothetical protein SIID45300_01720 [Candidatus Magnetaquicoccaceae bacterium FCR-1]|uniref:Secreted protein n=1 Tax=Candidatus Magnetaquiglobus chichijimensis TaxID=3141448 RepID=A0ABQ0C922_9PROT